MTSGARPCVAQFPRLTGSGARVVFLSNCDPLGLNPDRGFEVFWATNPALHLVVAALGPVDLVLTDPSGRLIDRNTSSIPMASYERIDLDGDSVEDRRITIPEAVDGLYTIQVLARPEANEGDPVELTASINGLTRQLTTGTIADVAGRVVYVGNQSFAWRSSSITPVAGRESRISLAAKLPHRMPSSGPIELLWWDGQHGQPFSLGTVEALDRYGRFSGVVDDFAVTLRLREPPDGSVSLRFSGRGGDLAKFAGSEHLNMTVAVRVGPYTHFYNWRFARSAQTGKLTLR